jgi:hypothetical protein
MTAIAKAASGGLEPTPSLLGRQCRLERSTYKCTTPTTASDLIEARDKVVVEFDVHTHV